MTRSDGPTSESATAQPTTSDPFSFDVDLGTALIELDREECLELLAAKSVGRLAYAADYGARILPVNYVLADDSIIFRTVPDGQTSTTHSTPCVPSRLTTPMSSSSRAGVWSQSGAWSWRPGTTSITCGTGSPPTLGHW